jgi:hypothetical protein
MMVLWSSHQRQLAQMIINWVRDRDKAGSYFMDAHDLALAQERIEAVNKRSSMAYGRNWNLTCESPDGNISQ